MKNIHEVIKTEVIVEEAIEGETSQNNSDWTHYNCLEYVQHTKHVGCQLR
jgi:hypothetical protein